MADPANLSTVNASLLSIIHHSKHLHIVGYHGREEGNVINNYNEFVRAFVVIRMYAKLLPRLSYEICGAEKILCCDWSVKLLYQGYYVPQHSYMPK